MDNSPLSSAPPDAAGALYFLPGQFLFVRRENGREVAKALSSDSIARAFREYRTDTGWVERRILRYREQPEANYLLSYEPARVRTIFVEAEKGEVVEISVPLPALVLFAKGREFFLWATKGRKITPKSLLSHAPLPNLGSGSDFQGKICFRFRCDIYDFFAQIPATYVSEKPIELVDLNAVETRLRKILQ